MPARFNPGRIVATASAMMSLGPASIAAALRRHLAGDWGELDDEDKATNDAALRNGGRLLSAYTYTGEKVWVITERDRSVTTVLLPDEY
jgi:hypothetical protein